jgi:choline kinase
MRPIIIGAGRGSRLAHMTEEIPKTLVPVMGRPMLEWILDALGDGGFCAKDVVFVCGYQADVIRARYPDFTYVENRDWEHNNILLSLLCAREHLRDGFVSTYADIVYRGRIVRDLVASPFDIALGTDTDWRRRYRDRSNHPESDGEKLSAKDGVVTRVSRRIEPAAAHGEFIGVQKLTAAGAGAMLEAFDRAKSLFAGREFREGRTFEKAYIIDLYQWMIEQDGTTMHAVDMHGGYMEIDTLEDHACAQKWWDESAR